MGLWFVSFPSLSPLTHYPSIAAEVVIHGEPSGLDNTTSCFGGAVRLNRSLGRFETLPHLPSMNILLTNTKSPRKTKLLVKKVRELNEALPLCVKPIFESIEAISQEFLQMIEPYASLSPSRITYIDPAHMIPISTPRSLDMVRRRSQQKSQLLLLPLL